jgi:hypothetical protein
LASQSAHRCILDIAHCLRGEMPQAIQPGMTDASSAARAASVRRNRAGTCRYDLGQAAIRPDATASTAKRALRRADRPPAIGGGMTAFIL